MDSNFQYHGWNFVNLFRVREAAHMNRLGYFKKLAQYPSLRRSIESHAAWD